jgi:hypothetical protein
MTPRSKPQTSHSHSCHELLMRSFTLYEAIEEMYVKLKDTLQSRSDNRVNELTVDLQKLFLEVQEVDTLLQDQVDNLGPDAEDLAPLLQKKASQQAGLLKKNISLMVAANNIKSFLGSELSDIPANRQAIQGYAVPSDSRQLISRRF